MSQLRIVLTGGPCAGKTSALLFAEKFFVGQNVNVIKIPETATLLFDCGIKLPESDIAHRYFQMKMLELQVLLEDTAFATSPDNSVILCDRGIMDTKGKNFVFLNNVF